MGIRIKTDWILTAALGLTACSSAPKAPPSPDWIRQPTRTADNGYIVYVGTGEDPSAERAQFKSEAAAIQDLANECSFVPKGSRIEDQYHETTGKDSDAKTISFTKVGISFQDCDQAKQTNDPPSILKLASTPMTQELKRYQDLVDTAPEETADDQSEVNPMLASTKNPPDISDPDRYFIARQQVSYMKEIVILQPATTVIPTAQQIQASSAPIAIYERQNPQTKTWNRSWSQVERTTTVPHGVNSQLTKPSTRTQRFGNHQGHGGKRPPGIARPPGSKPLVRQRGGRKKKNPYTE